METLRRVWEVWKRFGRFIGDIVARIALTLFYFTIFVPFGLGVRLLSDPLGTKRRSRSSLWLSRRTTDSTLQDARRQF
jgi:hypothetical protein